MIMATNSSTGNLLPGEIKKGSGTSNTSTSISHSTNLNVPSNSVTTTTTTNTTSEVKIEKLVSSSVPVNAETRWIFPLEKIEQSPSRLDGVSKENELTERQEAALFINDLGLKLKVTQLCINTAIIYMHRFYMIHSLKKFHHYIVATSCLFFACKVEEQPRRLREFIDIVQSLFHKSNEPINHNSEEYRHYGDQIMALESSLIQTLGFNVLINHAHTVIIKTCQMIKAPRDLAEAAYLTATNCLILTDFCVKFSSEKVACFCIYLACKWTGLVIPTSSEGMQWYEYVNHDIKEQELEDISEQYLAIYGKCSNKIKKKLGITKNQDEINPQLHPKNINQSQPQIRKPNPSQQHPNRQTPSNVNTHQSQHPGQPHPNKQFQSNNYHSQQHTKNPNQQHSAGSQHNGYHSNSGNNHHYSNQQRQQNFQQQQNYQQRSGHNSNKHHPGGQSNPSSGNSNHSNNQLNTNKNPNVQTSKNIQHSNSANNPHNSAHFHNRSNFPNGASSGSLSQSHSSHNFNNQTGASSSINTKSNNNLNSGHGEGATNKNMNTSSHSNNGQQNNNNSNNNLQIKKSMKPEGMNSNYSKMNGNNTSLNLPNHNVKSSPSAPLNTSMKRGNEEISNNVTTAPNKIPKYVIDQKSAS